MAPGAPSVRDSLLLRLFETVNTNALSRVMGRLAGVPLPPPVLRVLAERFAALYGADLTEMAEPLIAYRTFDDFFTRRLRPGARPLAAGAPLLSPCDGTLGTCGTADGGALLQAKGHPYTLAGLVGSDAEAARLAGGAYWTIYLAPRNYHRVHCPVDAWVDGFVHLPGPLFPVNAFGVRVVDGLFERNERVVTLLRDAQGRRLALVMVGAYGVGSIELCFTPDRFRANRGGGAAGTVRRFHDGAAPRLAAGDELGVFHLGSTVVLLAERSLAAGVAAAPAGSDAAPGSAPPLREGAAVRMGAPLAFPA
ncbi:MAG TPA: archaetidylserine decarboxylase [Myxococcota bacterium]|jgi:phosphatidylserine decarboxylase|nr:archaetidylserine decarboxylase [Myxococcota bacterium]